MTELPKEINELKNLQHLLAYRYNHFSYTSFDAVIGVRLQEGFGGSLEGLQTLSTVEARPDGAALMRELEKLEKLRWLDIMGLTVDLSHALCTVIGKMNRLERMVLISVSEAEPLYLQHVSSPPPGLWDLLLIGWLERLPGWISELQSLRRLSLISSRLTREAIEALKSLPNLGILLLQDAYEGEELRFEEGGFQRLKRLILTKLGNLRELKIEKGALVILEQLCIYECPLLQEVPELQHLKNLNYAEVNGNVIF